MSSTFGFGRFVGLDASDAPELLSRMSKHELGIDGERYGIMTRLLARSEATVVDLGCAVVRKLIRQTGEIESEIGAVVLSSRIVGVQDAASAIVDRLGLDCSSHGVERACSGFPAATATALQRCRQLNKPVIVVAAEIISASINWELPDDSPADHQRARGQASKLFADGAAAVVIKPGADGDVHEILDAWSGDVPDDKQLIQKADISESVDPWGSIRPGSTGCVSMPGRRGFYLVKTAPKIMVDAIQRSLGNARLELKNGESVCHVVPHQPNGMILERLQASLAAVGEKPPTVWNRIKDSGNTVSASIPLAMSEVQDRLPKGVLVAMPSVGAGGPGYRPDVLSTGCVLVRMGGSIDG